MDEAGTPYCITIDSQTLEDETVTVRERDSMVQTREKIPDLVEVIEERIRF
jgi:glycyl-tRNA synthetase